MIAKSPTTLCQLYQLIRNKWVYMNIGYIYLNAKNEILLLEKVTAVEVFAVQVNQCYDFEYDEEEAITFTLNKSYALSFQSKPGAQLVWNRIQNILNEEREDDYYNDNSTTLIPYR